MGFWRMVAVAAALAGATVLGGAAAAGERSVTAAGEGASLLDKARSHGSVRVIIALDLAMQPEDALGRDEARRQRETLRATQEAVTRRAGLEDTTRFETIPFMAARVTAAQLERLLRDPDVALVQEDLPSPPLAGADR